MFGTLGLLVPAMLASGWFLFHSDFGEIAILWPSSIMFMALDTPAPSPMSTVIYIYTIAFIENFVLYAVIGVVTWPIAHFALRLYDSHKGSHSS